MSLILLDLGHGFCFYGFQVVDDGFVIGDQGLNVAFRFAGDVDARYRVVEGCQLNRVGVTRTDCLADCGHAFDRSPPGEVRGLSDRGGG